MDALLTSSGKAALFTLSTPTTIPTIVGPQGSATVRRLNPAPVAGLVHSENWAVRQTQAGTRACLTACFGHHGARIACLDRPLTPVHSLRRWLGAYPNCHTLWLRFP